MRLREILIPEPGDTLWCVLAKDSASIPWVARMVVTRFLDDARVSMPDHRKREEANDASILIEARMDADVIGGSEPGQEDMRITTVSFLGGHLSPLTMIPITKITAAGVATWEQPRFNRMICDGPFVNRSCATRRAGSRCEIIARSLIDLLRNPNDPGETRCADSTCPLDHRAIAESIRARGRELLALSVEQKMSETGRLP